LIIETKLNETFSSALMRARVLAQVVYYLKKIENLGYELPNIILVGDKDECFVLHYNYLIKYLDKEYDWSIAPSKAGKDNIALVQELTNDSKLQTECYVYMIDKYFDMKEVVSKIIQLVRGVKTQVRLTERNISKIFEYFCLKILRRTQSGKSRYNAREQVELFMLLILDPINCYIHPNKKNTAVFGRKHIAVNGDAFISFTNYYKFSYNAKEKRLFTSIADRLIADSQRRRKGDFYTPTIWHEPLGLMSWADFLHLSFTGTCQ
jgi:hypothetical protein